MEFSRQEYWSGLPFPSPGDLPNPGVKPESPALQTDSLPTEPLGTPYFQVAFCITLFICVCISGCAVSSLLCGLLSSCGKQGLLSGCNVGFSSQWLLLLQSKGSRSCGLQQLQRVGSAVVAPGLRSTGSIVLVHGLSCSAACGIFLGQGSNLCLLHWLVDALPLSH